MQLEGNVAIFAYVILGVIAAVVILKVLGAW